MSKSTLVRLYEHNNWANARIIDACAGLSDDQLDAPPGSATKGTIRETLWHLVRSQHGYVWHLTRREPRFDRRELAGLAELREAVAASGERLLELARDEPWQEGERLRTRDGYQVEPWVVMVQAINHATEHREQISSMLSALGVTPPDNDGWSYGDAAGALVPEAG